MVTKATKLRFIVAVLPSAYIPEEDLDTVLRRELMELYVAKRKPIRELVKLTGLSKDSISQLLAEYEIPVLYRKGTGKLAHLTNRELLDRPAKQIMKEEGVCYGTIRREVKARGLDKLGKQGNRRTRRTREHWIYRNDPKDALESRESSDPITESKGESGGELPSGQRNSSADLYEEWD